jgi:hypothetical protein
VHAVADASFLPDLRWSGARISEVLALTPAAIDTDSGSRSGPAAYDEAALGLEPNVRVALCESGYGDGRDHRRARDAEKLAAWLRRERVPIQCAAASRPALARGPLRTTSIYGDVSAPRSAPLPPTCGRTTEHHNP